MEFCRTRIAMPPGLAATHGVLGGAGLALCADARLAAERLLEAARVQAAALVDEEAARCRADIALGQQQALDQARAMLDALERMPREFLERTEPIVVELAQALFMRLVGELAPAERVAALLRQLQAAAPPRLPEAVLRLHPDEAALLAPGAGTGPALPFGWSLRPDPSLAPGRARLESAAGEWQLDFAAAALELSQALGTDDGGAGAAGDGAEPPVAA